MIYSTIYLRVHHRRFSANDEFNLVSAAASRIRFLIVFVL